ncbi:MAG TPA: hypothetical protein VLI91_10990, partial [Roseiarcus sp.]|nr:hypothetical protein [Roseiarcus sp.]
LGPFRLGRLKFAGWKSLDFLGFSRANRDFINGLRAIFAQKFFASAVPGEAWREDRRGAVEAVRRGRIMHEIELSLNSAFPQSIVQIERCLRRNPKAARPKSAG